MTYFFKIAALSFLFLGSSFANQADTKESAKQEKWEEISYNVEKWVDLLGRPIDPKIKKAVVALNALGITTYASCQGHLDGGLPYPWIDIELDTSEMEMIDEKIVFNFAIMDEIEKLIDSKDPDLSWEEKMEKLEESGWFVLTKENYDLQEKRECVKKIQAQSLYVLLEQFYHIQHRPYDSHLVLNNQIREVIRLQINGGEWQKLRPAEEMERKLNEYQKEMDRFAKFLENHFFQNEES